MRVWRIWWRQYICFLRKFRTRQLWTHQNTSHLKGLCIHWLASYKIIMQACVVSRLEKFFPTFGNFTSSQHQPEVLLALSTRRSPQIWMTSTEQRKASNLFWSENYLWPFNGQQMQRFRLFTTNSNSCGYFIVLRAQNSSICKKGYCWRKWIRSFSVTCVTIHLLGEKWNLAHFWLNSPHIPVDVLSMAAPSARSCLCVQTMWCRFGKNHLQTCYSCLDC